MTAPAILPADIRAAIRSSVSAAVARHPDASAKEIADAYIGAVTDSPGADALRLSTIEAAYLYAVDVAHECHVAARTA